MEFYRTIPSKIDARDCIRIDNLTQYCNSIHEVLQAGESMGKIYCLWGTFDINRELLSNGVQFNLPGCPNDFHWSITNEQQDDKPVLKIIASINTDTPDKDFRESIEVFMDDWTKGLSQ